MDKKVLLRSCVARPIAGGEIKSVGRIRNPGIALKIYALVALLTLVAATMGLLGLHSMRTADRKIAEIQNASQRAMTGERINGLINAVVMDSRGVYMARDQAESDKFGAPLLANLAAIGRAFETWQALMQAGRRPELAVAEDDVRSFIAYRRELVRLGHDSGAPAARIYGDNDVNRLNRMALNKEIVTLSAANGREIGRLSSELDDFFHFELSLMAGLGLAILITIGGAVAVVRSGIVPPAREPDRRDAASRAPRPDGRDHRHRSPR